VSQSQFSFSAKCIFRINWHLRNHQFSAPITLLSKKCGLLLSMTAPGKLVYSKPPKLLPF
jgi:hypothetical protein